MALSHYLGFIQRHAAEGREEVISIALLCMIQHISPGPFSSSAITLPTCNCQEVIVPKYVEPRVIGTPRKCLRLAARAGLNPTSLLVANRSDRVWLTQDILSQTGIASTGTFSGKTLEASNRVSIRASAKRPG
jgi:hypothetical protein